MDHMIDDAEWLEADGLGGFVSGAVGLVRTRRYHALLLAQTQTGRYVLTNGIEAWVETAAGRFPLSAQAYRPDVIFPPGRDHLAGFEAAPWPRWRFVGPDGTQVTQELLVSRATAETLLVWTADRPAHLTVRPLLSGRDYHALHHVNDAFDMTTRREGGGLVWRPYPGIPATTARGNFSWEDTPEWFYGFTYAAERARELDDGEDLASPGVFHFCLRAGPAVLVLRADAVGSNEPEALLAVESARRARSVRDTAADAYLAAAPDRQTLIAGFPWFTDWGRDSFIAVRGLLIARGRLAEAAAILLAWAEHVSEGMLPNRFPDGGAAPEYNSADASLWFVVAAHELITAGISAAEAEFLCAACLAIVAGYAAGTRYGIHMDQVDGLLLAGAPGVALTWMDAIVDGVPVTPRIGKPVELQALWVNALEIVGRMPGGGRFLPAALLARESVLAGFPDPETGGLIDVLDVDAVPGKRDTTVRPNQILAAGGLPFPVLTDALQLGVVAVVERVLLTPLGLRTLDPAHPAYCPHYRGGPNERDFAYHQGTAWPWLLGPFVAAWLAGRGHASDARAEARTRFLAPLRAHLATAGLGHVSEVVDADAPHTPGGCPFQAWSLGELIRIEAMLGVADGL
jgi:predicted glycogen debranching enzyme